MGKFYVYRGSTLVGVGSCPDGQEALQAVDGLQVGVGDPPGTLKPEVVIPVETYDMKRRRAYPTAGDQLDALWKWLGPTAPPGSDAAAIYQKLLDVKTRYPKT